MNTVQEKKGYKWTEEFGYIPEDWEIKTIKELASIQTGTKNTEDKIDNGLYPFFVRSQSIEHINEYAYDEEAVLTAGDGVGVGKVFHYINGKFNVHQRVYKISEFNNVIGKYFYLFFKNNFYSEVKKYTAKSSVDSVRLEMIADMSILLPPLPEQQKIASVLSDVDSLIDKTKELINKKKDLKIATMQKLLKPKEGWRRCLLGDICNIKKGAIITSNSLSKGNIPVIAGGKVPAYYHKEYNRSGKTITISASGASAGYVWFHNYPIFASDCSTISEDKNYCIEFVYYFLLLNQDLIYTLQAGGAQPHIHPSDIEPLIFSYPNISEQHQIATVLSDMDSEIESLEKELEKYKDLKSGMMQQLLTGKVRLV